MEEVGARIQDLWNGILDLSSKLVIPDWGSLIALLPIGVLVLVVLFFVATLIRYTRLGPRRRGMRRVAPIPPPGVHAGHGSFAPILAALGAFMLFVGLVVRGWFLVAGVAVLFVTLLYWGREAVREYDRIDADTAPGAAGAAVALVPPPGVHMPAPSFRPILVSIAVALLLVGLVAGPAVALAGVFALVVTLLGWLRDARREYSGVVIADRTGHPPTEPAPHYPVGTLAAIGVVVAAALVLNTGLLPPKASTAAGGPGASQAPGGGGGGGGASAAPSGSGGGGQPSGPAADVSIQAKNIAYLESSATAPAGKAFTLAFDNEDSGTPHNVAIHKGSPSGDAVFTGEIFPGPKTTVYQVPALAAGTYAFVCSVHPNMTGTLTVQ